LEPLEAVELLVPVLGFAELDFESGLEPVEAV